MFLAPPVTFLVPSPVKIAHVTYKLGHVWSVNLVCMAVIVTYHVPPIVKTTYVTKRMEHVLLVDLVGLEYTVKQVILFTIKLCNQDMDIVPGFVV